MIIFLLPSVQALSASSGANYRITADILDGGGNSISSASYGMMGKLRERGLSVPSGAYFAVGEGFLRSVYFSHAILAPIITGIAPSSGLNNGAVNITNLSGANFATGAAVKLSRSGQPDLIATNVTVVSNSKITCTFDLTGAVVGFWNVNVTNSDGRSGILPSAFEVAISYPAPTISSITPGTADNRGEVQITNLSGNYFRPGAGVTLSLVGQDNIIGYDVSVISSAKITCKFDLTNKQTGAWDVKVRNDDGQEGTLVSGFKIETPNIVVKDVVSTSNPFDPAKGPTTIQYSISKDTNIIMYIINMRGQRVWEYRASAGSEGGKVGVNRVVWNGLTSFQGSAGSGVYFVRITTVENGSVKTLGKTKLVIFR